MMLGEKGGMKDFFSICVLKEKREINKMLGVELHSFSY